MSIYEGKVYLGLPLISFPARVTDVTSRRAIVQHRIPGRDGDVIDDIGSHARRVIVETEISKQLLTKVFDSLTYLSWASGVVDALKEPLNFLQLIYIWWLNKQEIPFLSLPFSSFVVIVDKSEKWEGGKIGRFQLRLELLERLPFSLSSILGRISFTALWAFYGLRGGEILG